MRLFFRNLIHIFIYSPAAMLCFIFFRIFNRLIIKGYSDYKKHSYALICANHISAMDSFAIGHIFFPKAVFFPAKEELFKNPLLGNLIRLLNAFPVSRGYADMKILEQIAANSRNNLVLIHPEGTRQPVIKLGKAKKAVGKIIYLGKTCVIPLYIRGTQNILPKGSILPRLFRKVYINIGPPVELEDLYCMKDDKETAKAIVERVMDRLRALKEELEEELK